MRVLPTLLLLLSLLFVDSVEATYYRPPASVALPTGDCVVALFREAALAPFIGRWAGKTEAFQNGVSRGVSIANFLNPAADNIWLTVGYEDGWLVLTRDRAPDGGFVLNLVELFGAEERLWLPFNADYDINDAARRPPSQRDELRGTVRAKVSSDGDELIVHFDLEHIGENMQPKGRLRLRRSYGDLELIFEFLRNRSSFREVGDLKRFAPTDAIY